MKKIFSTLLTAFAVMVMSCCHPSTPELDEDPTEIELLSGWKITRTPYRFDSNPRTLHFVNAETGFMFGYSGGLYKTVDSGKQWLELDIHAFGHPHSIAFIDESLGFVAAAATPNKTGVRENVIIKTSNGGKSWSKVFAENDAWIHNLHFFNEATGLAIFEKTNSSYYLSRTNDGGHTWEIIEGLPKIYGERFYPVDDLVYAIAYSEDFKKLGIIKSIDQGLTWSHVGSPLEEGQRVRKVHFATPDIGFIEADAYCYRTSDGGVTWTPNNLPFDLTATFHFYSENDGICIKLVRQERDGFYDWFGGAWGYETHDGGQTWKKSEFDESIYFMVADFPVRDLGYAANAGQFYKIEHIGN